MFEFPCHRWLAKDEDDRQITRELVCTNGSQSADMYISPGNINFFFYLVSATYNYYVYNCNIFFIM